MQHILGVCPHDVTKDPEKWAAFAQEMKDRGVLDCTFTPETCFERFATGFETYSMAYAHPLHAVQLWTELGFTPLAAYKDVFDEAVLICNKQVKSPSLVDMSSKTVACIHGTPSYAAYLISLHDQGMAPPQRWAAHTSYPDVVMAVAQGEAQYGIVLKSVWDLMMTLRDRVKPFHATNIRQLVHVFLAAPSQRLQAERMVQVMTTMHQDERGAAVLKRLGCTALSPMRENDMARIKLALDGCGLRAAA